MTRICRANCGIEQDPPRIHCRWLIQPDRPAKLLFGRVMGFVGEHPLLGATAAPSFLTPDLLDARLFGGNETPLEPFDLVEQKPAREEAVQCLVARGLTFDL